jgi:hypothetical protein
MGASISGARRHLELHLGVSRSLVRVDLDESGLVFNRDCERIHIGILNVKEGIPEFALHQRYGCGRVKHGYMVGSHKDLKGA